jgi:hypothetical protein
MAVKGNIPSPDETALWDALTSTHTAAIEQFVMVTLADPELKKALIAASHARGSDAGRYIKCLIDRLRDADNIDGPKFTLERVIFYADWLRELVDLIRTSPQCTKFVSRNLKQNVVEALIAVHEHLRTTRQQAT